jgi:hypothetical protein
MFIVRFRYEALVFLIMYALYIVLMYFNPRIEAWIVPRVSSLMHRGKAIGELKRARFGSVEQLASLANNNDMTDPEELDNAS